MAHQYPYQSPYYQSPYYQSPYYQSPYYQSYYPSVQYSSSQYPGLYSIAQQHPILPGQHLGQQPLTAIAAHEKKNTRHQTEEANEEVSGNDLENMKRQIANLKKQLGTNNANANANENNSLKSAVCKGFNLAIAFILCS